MKKIFSRSQISFWLFIFFSFGVITGSFFASFSVYLCLALVCGLISFIANRLKYNFLAHTSLLIFFLVLGALWHQAYYPQGNTLNSSGLHEYTLKVISLPQRRSSQNTFQADVIALDQKPCRMHIRVVDFTRSMNFLYTYRVNAKLSQHAYRGNVSFTLWISRSAVVRQIKLNAIDNMCRTMNLRLLDIFKNNLSDQGYRFLASVFLGRRELLSVAEKQIFTNAGIAHLLAISGSNVGLAAVIVFFILKLFHFKFKTCLVASIIFLSTYMLLAGPNPPIVRAVIMYSIIAAGFFLQRKIDPLNSLGLAGLVCVVANPTWIFDASFQLSFLSIFALIIGFALYIPKPSRFSLFNHVRYLFLSSLFVTVFITPVVAHYFKRIYILSVFHNILLIPFFSFILSVSFLLIVFAPFHGILSAVGAVLSLMISWFYACARVLGSVKFTFIDSTFSGFFIILYYVCLAIAIYIFYAVLPYLKYSFLSGAREKSREY